MSKSSDRAMQQQALAQQQQIAAAQLAMANEFKEKPDPNLEAYRRMIGNNLKFFGIGLEGDAAKNFAPDYDLNARNKDGTQRFQGGPIFSTAAGLLGRAKRESARTGLGAITMGTQGTSPGQLAQMNEQRIREFTQSGELAASDAVDQARRETLGGVLPSNAAYNQRYLTGGNLLGGASSANTAFQNSIPQHTPWWQIALQTAGTLGPLAMGLRGGGGGESGATPGKEAGKSAWLEPALAASPKFSNVMGPEAGKLPSFTSSSPYTKGHDWMKSALTLGDRETQDTVQTPYMKGRNWMKKAVDNKYNGGSSPNMFNPVTR